MKAFKYRCYPTDDQKLLLERTFGCCRFVWNQCLAQANAEYEAWKANPELSKPDVSSHGLTKKIKILRRQYPFLTEVSAVALCQSVIDLANAFTRFFNGAGAYPTFKEKRNCRKSFRFIGVGEIKVHKKSMQLTKSKIALKIAWRKRKLPSQPGSYTVTKGNDEKYWVSFVCREYDLRLTNGSGVVGVDLGLKDLVVDSNGVKYENPKYFVSAQKRLAKAQRRLARRVKGSARRAKAKLAVARIYAKIANQRKDYLHKITRQLVNENQVIGIEDLLVSGMLRNRKLSKGIWDAGFGLFRKFLIDKARESQHAVVVVLDRWEPSTQCCSHCGLKRDVKLTLSERSWTCSYCHAHHDRDTNAALNCKRVAEYLWTQTQPLGGSVVVGYSVLETLVSAPAAPGSAQSITGH